MTSLDTTFNIAFALLGGETQDYFNWALQQLRTFTQQEEIEDPFVIINDYDKAFRNAAMAVYLDTVKLQLCLWHIMKKVAHHVKIKWQGSLEGTVLAESVSGPGSRIRNTEDNEEGIQTVDNPANDSRAAEVAAFIT
jgi:hypothetical protein